MHESLRTKTFLTLARRLLMLGCVSSLLSCDIPYVAEGSWDVVYELPGQQRFGVWHISEEIGVKVEGELSLRIDELELAGSRMSWSANATNPLEPAGSVRASISMAPLTGTGSPAPCIPSPATSPSPAPGNKCLNQPTVVCVTALLRESRILCWIGRL